MSDSLKNPYELSPDKIQEPPTHFLGVIKHLGPGFILSASIVGSGELIATTLLGAEAGFVTFWVILVSCLVKVTLQLEFGKHAIQSGESTFSSLNQLPGKKLGKANWSIWTWLALMTVKFLQVGGIVGGVAIIMDMVMPMNFLPDIWNESADGAFLKQSESNSMWAIVIALFVSLLVFKGLYLLLEKLSLIMIGLFTLLTLACVFMLQTTEFAVTWSEIGSGLTFGLPAETLIIITAIGAFGITGVGGDEIMTYNYWLLEKGYAAKTGPRDDSPEWNRRAKGWIKIMYWDAILSMVVYTIMTAAFYILGAAVLNRQGIVPDKSDLISVLGRMYTDTLGQGAHGAFLIGAGVVLFSTLFAALAGWTRLFSDCFGQIGFLDFKNPKQRNRLIGWLAWVIPLIWAFLFMIFKAPGFMVILGGVGTAAILLIVVVAAFHFRYRRLPKDLRPSRVYDVFLWISSVVIVAAGIYSLVVLILKQTGKL